MVKFPINIQTEGRMYTVESIIYPKHASKPYAIAYTQSFLGKRRVKDILLQMRLASRVLELRQS